MQFYREFYLQKYRAGQRNIDWHFTFEEWLAWWGDDIVNRGRSVGKLVMARKGDTGPYHIDNVIKISHSKNLSDAHTGKVGSRGMLNKTAWNNGLSKEQQPCYGKTWTQSKVTCPHCSKEGGKSAMMRHHFDNCGLIRQGV